MPKRKLETNPIRKLKSTEPPLKKIKLHSHLRTFAINDKNLTRFERDFPSEQDCVVNALQLVDCIDRKVAAILRLLVGKVGLEQKQIEQIFELMNNGDYEYMFQEYRFTCDEIKHLFDTYLKPGHVMLMGVEYAKTGFKHVTVVGRHLDNTLVLIDPQLQSTLKLELESIVIDDFKRWVNSIKTFYLLTVDGTTLPPPPIKTIRGVPFHEIVNVKQGSSSSSCAIFKMNSDKFNKFIHSKPIPRYAVLDSFKVIHYVDQKILDLLRIAMFRDVGLCLEDVENMLSIINEQCAFKFVQGNVYDMAKTVPRGYLTYGGVKWHTGGKHPIIVAKKDDGTLLVINPQTWNVIKTDSHYTNEFKNAAQMFILKTFPNPLLR